MFVRSAAQLAEDRGARAVQREAAEGLEGEAPGRVPPKKPAKAKAAEALALELESDPIALEGAELLWLPAEGTQTSELEPQSAGAGRRSVDDANDGHGGADRGEALLGSPY